MERKRVFIPATTKTGRNAGAATGRNGVTGSWVTEEAGEKLAQIWEEDARITITAGTQITRELKSVANAMRAWAQYVGVGKSPDDGFRRRSYTTDNAVTR